MKTIGISGTSGSLTTVMTFRLIIALFMGLVLQLSQVRMSAAAETAKSCGNDESMSCCDGLDSCPCVEESDSGRKPVPLAPSTVELKLLVSNSSGTGLLEFLFSPQTDPVFSNICRLESKSGYAGVPLNVAFCTFVI